MYIYLKLSVYVCMVILMIHGLTLFTSRSYHLWDAGYLSKISSIDVRARVCAYVQGT